jgi:hypothetical protein
MMRLIGRTLLVATGVAVGVVVVNSWTSTASTGPATVRVTTKQTSFSRVDIGRGGRSPGDVEIASALVYNRRITPRALGHVEYECTYTVGINRMCRATIFLPKGKLMVGGIMRYRQFYELAVLGGTGLYDNARGTLTVTRIGRNPPRELLFFRLVG